MKKVTILFCAIFAVTLVFGQGQVMDHNQQKATQMDQLINDIDPDPSPANLKPSRDMFDLLFEFPHHLADGEYPVETDGEYIYTAHWNNVTFQRYEMDGTFVESFTIAGAGNIRDLTYDGTYFYGSDNSNTIYELCLANEELIDQFTTTANFSIRGITYDPEEDGFWTTDGFNPPITLIDRDGEQMDQINPNIGSLTGLGWDNYSDGDGPYLWVYAHPGFAPDRNILKQVEIATGNVLQTFNVQDAASLNPDQPSGGLTITNLAYPGKWAFLGAAQNDMIWCLELAFAEDMFTVIFDIEDEDGNEIEEAIVTLNGQENDPGDYEFLVPEGDYDYTVEKEHYVTVEGEITVDDDKTVDVIMDFELYTLTLEADPEEGGTLDGDGDYRYEEEVEVSAELEEGYGFVNWTDEDGEEVSDEPTFDFIMPGEDVTLTANFYKMPVLTLEANPEEGGTVHGAGIYEEGTVVEIIANASENEKIYQFVNWTGDTDHVDDPEEAETTVTMPGEDVSLTANFQDVTAITEAEEVELSVYPNPAKNNFTVKSNELINEVKLISISGQVVKIIVVDALETEFNVSNLKEGIYLLQIHTNEGVITERVQISR